MKVITVIITVLVFVLGLAIVKFGVEFPFYCLTKPDEIRVGPAFTSPKYNCLMAEVAITGNTKICSYLNDAEECYVDVAIVKKDEKICEEIGYELFKSSCYSGVAAVKQDPSLCFKAKFNSASTDSCLLNLSRFANGLDICNSMLKHNGAFYAECIYNIAKNTKDITLCNLIPQVKVLNPEYTPGLFTKCQFDSKPQTP